MKKNSIGKILKRTILLILLVCIIIVGLVYFLDQYKGTSASYTNKYTSEYWLNHEGFTEYAEWIVQTHPYNVKFPDEYIAPYNEDDSIPDKLLASRYKEEALQVIFETLSVIDKYELQIKNIKSEAFQGSLEELALKAFGLPYDFWTNNNTYKPAVAYDNLVTKGYTGTLEDFNKIINTLYDQTKPTENSYLAVKAKGYTGTQYDYLLILACDTKQTSNSLFSQAVNDGYSKDKYTWLIEALGIPRAEKRPAYLVAQELGYKNTRPNWQTHWFNAFLTDDKPHEILGDYGYPYDKEYELAVAVYNDAPSADVEQVYDVVIRYDVDKVAEIEKLLVVPYQYRDLYNSLNLLTWYDYCNRYLCFNKILENDKYEFWFSGITTEFKLVEKATGNMWYSNPQEEDLKVQPGVKNAQRSLFSIAYSALKGVTGTYSSYNHSTVDYDLSSNNKSNKFIPNYATKFLPESNTVQVWYKLEDRSKTTNDFPEYISKERFDEIMARNTQLALSGAVDGNGEAIPNMQDEPYKKEVYTFITNNVYGLVLADAADNKYGFDYYKLSSKDMGFTSVINLYTWLYDWCQYTEEDLKQDNEQFGIELEDKSFYFEIGFEYELTDEGLSILIPGNSIVDSERAPIVSIDVLPYFTASKVGIEGYTVIPDGSGAVLEHDNGNYVYSSYNKRVYTTDLTSTSAVKKTSTNDIMFPMFAVINTGNKSGLILECEQGGGQAQINADVSGRGNESYNKQNFSFFVRESKSIYIGPSYDREKLDKWSNRMITQDIKINAVVLNEDELNYSAVAKRYREILVNRYGLTENDTTYKTVLDMDVIGTYEFDNNFLGIPYTDKDTLTTFSQLEEMLNEYLDMNITNINVFYKGWRNSGLIDKSFEKMKISSLLGTKKELLNLVSKYKKNVTIYPYLSFGQISDYYESFGQNHYTTRSVDGKFVVIYPYDLNTNLFDVTATKISVLSPRFYYRFMQSLVDTYTNKIGLNTLSLDYIGSNLAGEYKKGVEMYKVDAIKEQVRSLELAVQSGITNINLYHPYDYAFKYVTNAKEIPYQSTKYEILDYSIPFYQLVVSGLFDYSGESINANSEKGIQEHLMRILETGSNLSFTFTYDNSSELLNTDYNTYFYTSYSEWLNDVETLYQTLEEIGINRCRLTKHEMIAGYDNVCKVTYTNSVETIEILLNYSRVSVNVDGYKVPAKGYTIMN